MRVLVCLSLLLALAVSAGGCQNAEPAGETAAAPQGTIAPPQASEPAKGSAATPGGPPETGNPPVPAPPSGATTGAATGETPAGTEPGAVAPPPRRVANRLAKETSPYLLLHAHNPVDWHPWGEEALAKAWESKKLIFLSIGYSSCYWCHVMERESFMDDEVAAYLNQHYVCIKVDREERPDVDEIYMTAIQALGVPGGWPLSAFLTPDARPIVGGTYFPPRAKGDNPGFLDVLKRVQGAWTDQRDRLEEQANAITAAIERQLRPGLKLNATPLAQQDVHDVFMSLSDEYDTEHGGFGSSERAKFPRPSVLLLLLNRMIREPDSRAAIMLTTTLDRMARGGIWDHVGGGFHRYSTDRQWLVPHFEKMLYDQGQLASVYAEAFRQTKRDDFRRIAIEINEFLLRELRDEGGAFYAALDAETDGHEGQYYVWTPAELTALIPAADAPQFGDLLGAAAGPNFEERFVVLHAPRAWSEAAEQYRVSEAELRARTRPWKAALLAARNKRPRPLTDTKILSGWNGLAIRGLADSGRLLDEPRFTQAAAEAAQFVLAKLRSPDGRLLRTYGQGQAKLNAYLDDYAFLIDGLIALHRATNEANWLDAAEALMQVQIKNYADEAGGFHFTSGDHEKLIARIKDPADGATPSGNSVSIENLVYLGRVLNRPEYLERAAQASQAFSDYVARAPSALPRFALALDGLLEAGTPK